MLATPTMKTMKMEEMTFRFSPVIEDAYSKYYVGT